MGSFAFDIYPYNDPNGTRLVRITASKGVQLGFRLPEQGFGMSDGQIIIHSSHADATAANFRRHNLVKVVYIADNLAETKVGGFFLEEGDFVALSTDEQGGRLLTFSGPNTIYYLERMILREQPFSQSAGALALGRRGGVDVAGMWTWGADADGREPGPIMVRVLEEGFYQPGPGGTSADAPLADATWDFSRSADSASAAWDATGDEWQVPWGTTGLDMAILFMKEGGLHFRASADLLFSAYNADPGVNRTSATFATGKVRFAAGVNIATEVKRQILASRERSAMLVTGSDYTTQYVTGGSAGVTWIGHLSADAVSGNARLTAAGTRELDEREVSADSAFPLQHIVSEGELSGGYVPFVHYQPGDIVTLHTGTGAHDYNEFGINVAAVRILHDAAGNWFGMAELGSPYLSADSKAFEERANRIIRQARSHTHPEMLCRPGVLESATRWYFTNDNATPAVTADAAWDAGDVLNADAEKQLSTSTGGTSTGDRSATFVGDVLFNQHLILLDSATAAIVAAGGATVRMQARVKARHGTGINESIQDVISQLGIRVTQGATGTIRGTALPLHSLASSAGSSKWPAQATMVNRVFPPAAAGNTLAAVAGTVAGDYLVVESGYSNFTAGTTGGTMRLHRAAASALPENETETADLNSWIEIGSTGGLATVADGHPDLIGTSIRASRCDHRHDLHRDAAPTVNDDAAMGYKLGTVWAQLDSLTASTAIVGTWMLVDTTTGAAKWLELPSGLSEAEVNALIATHAAAADPHTGYLLESAHTEGVHTAMPGLATQAELDAHAATSHGSGGFHYEALMAASTSPPEPLETGDGSDWLYVLVAD